MIFLRRSIVSRTCCEVARAFEPGRCEMGMAAANLLSSKLRSA